MDIREHRERDLNDAQNFLYRQLTASVEFEKRSDGGI